MMLRRVVAAAALSGASLLFPWHTETAAEDAALTRARALLRRVPLIDGHNDYPWEVREKAKGDIL